MVENLLEMKRQGHISKCEGIMHTLTVNLPAITHDCDQRTHFQPQGTVPLFVGLQEAVLVLKELNFHPGTGTLATAKIMSAWLGSDGTRIQVVMLNFLRSRTDNPIPYFKLLGQCLLFADVIFHSPNSVQV